MANAREIQSRMKSIKDTMKITNAMYMISSSKLKKAKKNLADTEPYFYAMQGEISRILRHVPEMENKYFDERNNIKPEDKRIGYIVVTADKGLAGSYNHNIFKEIEECMQKNANTKLFVVGEMGRQYFKKKGLKIAHQFHYTAQNPTVGRARNIADIVINQFLDHKVDEVIMIYTRMINSMQVESERIKLLPLGKSEFNTVKIPAGVRREELIMSPSAEDVINNIIPNYVQGFIYGALVESFSSEQNLRMMAMQAATNSAQAMLHDLSIQYNRVRQAAITQEITEVVAGAKAQKKKKKK